MRECDGGNGFTLVNRQNWQRRTGRQPWPLCTATDSAAPQHGLHAIAGKRCAHV